MEVEGEGVLFLAVLGQRMLPGLVMSVSVNVVYKKK